MPSGSATSKQPESKRPQRVDLDELLATDVGGLDPEGCLVTLQDIQRVRGQLSRLEGRISMRVDALSADGGTPPADAHARSQRVTAAEARRRERRARLLDDAPRMADALGDGDISDDHADALAAAVGKASDAVRERVLDSQDRLAAQARRLAPDTFRRYCNQQVRKAERNEGIDRAESQRRNTRLRSWIDAETGMRHISGQLHPELGGAVWNAIQAEVGARLMADPSDGLVDRDRLAAEALGRLVAGGHAAARPNRADVSVLVDLDTLRHGLHDRSVCELSDSSLLSPAAVRRLACDADLIPVVLDATGQVLDVGRAKRLATAAQRSALRAMHHTCGVPGCDVGFDDCQVHHLLDWDHGGPTDLDNLVPACSRHHHLLHEGGWHAAIRPPGADSDDRRCLVLWPPGSDPPADAVSQPRATPSAPSSRTPVHETARRGAA